MNKLPAWIVAGTVTVGGVGYYLVREGGPTAPQPLQTHEPQPSPSHEPVCNPPASTEKRCSSTVTCDCWTSEDDCVWTKIPPVVAPGPVCDAMVTCGCWKPDGPCAWTEVPAIPPAPGPVCDANLTCGCWKQADQCAPWVEVPPIGPAPGRVCGGDVTCDCWEQSSPCSEWTKRPACPSPPPSPGTWGVDWNGKPLPAPPALSCKSLPDDPPGLLREGEGCDAKGGDGTAAIVVTNANSSGPGSLVAALDAISPTARRVIIDPSVAAAGKPIVIQAQYVSKKRNVTLDCNGATISQAPWKANVTNRNGLGFGALDDLIVTNCRFIGTFFGTEIKPVVNANDNPIAPIQSKDWIPPQNNGNGFLDGDVNAIPCESWDAECQGMAAPLRRSVVRAIFDRNTWDRIGDDALGIWGGGRYISFTRNLVLRSFHPSTTGWKGLPLPDPALQRLWNSWLYNVASGNGERNLIYPREGTHWWLFDRNFIEGWSWFQTKNYQTLGPEWNFPQGVRVSGQAPLEANMGVGRANCALGNAKGMPTGGPASAYDPAKANSHESWGFAFDNGGCDSAQACAPNCTKWSGSQVQKFGPCHPRASQGTYYFQKNEGEAYEWYSEWPKGYAPPPLPYQPDLARPWSRVLDEAGAKPRTPDEQALIDRLKVRAAAECKVPVKP